jgi:hypothetical protein
VLQAVPGASLQLADSLWLHSRVEIPFVDHLFGAQTLGPTSLVLAQWTALVTLFGVQILRSLEIEKM